MDKIAIIGLGYVGLPLAIEFGKILPTIGLDINKKRIEQLNQNIDITNQISKKEFNVSKSLLFTSKPNDISKCNIFIITVPTPKDAHRRPDLNPIINATKTVAMYVKKDDIIIYESTVYPGVTEDLCVPILEKISGLKYIQESNKERIINGFYCGYSPERINPGDVKNHFTSIIKITAGSTKKIEKKISILYSKIIKAGTYPVSSIKIAESVKVIENVQRDVNIGLMNELAVIFNKLDLDTEEILKAAGTKWNFLPFHPGLVGGHCIGIDPYYLIHKSIEVGYTPEIINSTRRLNDSMGLYIAGQIIKLMSKKNIKIAKSKVLFLGFTYKANCSDIRNTLLLDTYNELKDYNCSVDIYDPHVNEQDLWESYKIELTKDLKLKYYDAILLAVNHDNFKKFTMNKLLKYTKKKNLIYDINYTLPKDKVDGRL
tara:strand:- start:213 stop:1502 length:1290 start_codon:yes stop_codon:yes gene_type:complete